MNWLFKLLLPRHYIYYFSYNWVGDGKNIKSGTGFTQITTNYKIIDIKELVDICDVIQESLGKGDNIKVVITNFKLLKRYYRDPNKNQKKED